jgi:glycosyltransferase involved in cell wall biosynthesis
VTDGAERVVVQRPLSVSVSRRLLLVSHVFPPLVAGGAPRMSAFARMLPDHGWDVTVLTGRAGASAVDRAGATDAGARARVVTAWSPSAVVPRGIATPRHGARALARRVARTAAASVLFPDREVLWVPAAFAAGRGALAREPHDAVLASYAPGSSLVVGHALARMFRLPFVVDFRDLWSTLPMPVFATPLHRAAARALEHALVRRASRLVAVSPGMAVDLASVHGLAAGDAIAITNGFDPADAARVVDTRNGEPRPFRLVYAGSVNAHYDLGILWTALRTLAESGHVRPDTLRVEFVGNLAIGDARAHGVDAFVATAPFVPHERVFEALGPADALLVVERPGYYARNGYAAKVFDYLLTGKPVLAIVERGGNTDQLLRAANVGHIVEPGDELGLRTALLELLACKGARPHHVDCSVPPLRDFDRSRLVAKLAGVLDDVVANEPHGRW